ncbi:GGDEF domain-containing protein [Vibrio lamellibrachiae]|uniref:GGDEF domain-containing protein n=1 Tax=Vibrio lamellibrachiae TaxID=2910253 RepID=UPI003D0E41D3
MEYFSLDIRTLNSIVILFSVIFSIGLLLYQYSQSRIKGLNMFAISIFILGVGPFLISLRGVVPGWASIILGNLVIAVGFQLALYSLCQFRQAPLRYGHLSAVSILFLTFSFIYFTYQDPSINARILSMSIFLAIVTLSTATVILKGKHDDLPLALRMMASSFIVVGIFMIFRVTVILNSSESSSFMEGPLINQLPFLLCLFLIVSMTFSMLWLINARLLLAIKELSFTDPLTKLNNRRSLDQVVTSIMAQSDNAPISVIMTDIDRFKVINDKLGHLVGDKVITEVSQLIKNSIDPSAKAFRFGGDEIIIILPNACLDRARKVADELRKSITSTVNYEKYGLSITSSFGVAELDENEEWEQFLSRADKALYRAKNMGRNAVAA